MKFEIEKPSYCNNCQSDQNCQLLDKFQLENQNFRSLMHALEQLKQFPEEDKKLIQQRQQELLRNHIGQVDSIWSLADNRACPNKEEFKT